MLNRILSDVLLGLGLGVTTASGYYVAVAIAHAAHYASPAMALLIGVAWLRRLSPKRKRRKPTNRRC